MSILVWDKLCIVGILCNSLIMQRDIWFIEYIVN